MRGPLRSVVQARLIAVVAAVVLVGGMAGPIAITSAAQARPNAAGHHVAASQLRFAKWGLRVLVGGQPRVVFMNGSQFVHCPIYPVVRLTANFRLGRIAGGTRIRDDWYVGAQRYASGAFLLPPGSGRYLDVWLGNPSGMPDGVVTVKMLVRGKLAAQGSVQLTTVTC